MSPLFWSRLHGGATHFPIALLFGAALFDTLGFLLRGYSGARDLRVTGYWLLLVSGLSSFGAVFSGLALTKWKLTGTGVINQHHLFVWPAFALIVGLTSWRIAVGEGFSRHGFAIYLSVLALACALVGAAGFSGGEIMTPH